MTPGAPGTALSPAVRCALTAASRRPRGVGSRFGPWEPKERTAYGGYVVTLAQHHLPYGTSAHHGARYAHLVRFVWVAWRRGRPAGFRARWWCGASCDSPAVQLTDEPARELCPMCQFSIARSTREAGAYTG